MWGCELCEFCREVLLVLPSFYAEGVKGVQAKRSAQFSFSGSIRLILPDFCHSSSRW
jgi:hypothetical protein